MSIIINQIHDAGEPLTRVLRRRLTAAARLLLDEYHFENGEVAIILAGDSFLQQLNSRYRGLDAPTDVLTFSMLEPADREQAAAGEVNVVTVGDIYISLDRARDQAIAGGYSFEREVLLLAIHGLLHLFGYDHNSAAAAEAMEQREVDILNLVERIPGEKKAMERLIRSFRDAFAGLFYCFATQRNMAIHLAAGAVVTVLAFLLHLESWELFLVMTAVFAVLITETINTAIEKTVDLITQEQHKLAHIAKDVAAGAVLLAAFYSVLVGLFIFGPCIWEALLKLIHF